MTASPAEAYPLLLEPLFHPRVWGGRRLAGVVGAALPEGPIGESWSMGADNPVRNGPLAGRTLGSVVATNPQGILGYVVQSSGRNDLPLLFKILDANDVLSIQVHPDDDYARRVEGVAFGKTEAWYVLDATPGAYVIHGFTRPVTREEVRPALADGSIEGLLRKVELQQGDAFLVPAGTVHAIGGGLLLAEIQENSDVTYRLYDWGRPREMHVEQGLAVMQLGPPGFTKSRPLDLTVAGGTITYLVACPYFVYQHLTVHGDIMSDTGGRSLHCLFCSAGEGTIAYDGGSETLHQGETAVIPAALGGYTLHGRGFAILRSFVPDLRVDVVEPLEAAGSRAPEIAALGGAPGNAVAAAAGLPGA